MMVFGGCLCWMGCEEQVPGRGVSWHSEGSTGNHRDWEGIPPSLGWGSIHNKGAKREGAKLGCASSQPVATGFGPALLSGH